MDPQKAYGPNPHQKLYEEYAGSFQHDTFRKRTLLDSKKRFLGKEKVNGDPVLSGEQIDDRYGSAIVTRPNDELIKYIEMIQISLKSSVTDSGALWLPRMKQLHMTILEILVGASKDDLELYRKSLEPLFLSTVCAASDVPTLHTPLLVIDKTALALTLTSTNCSHIRFRASLFDHVRGFGIEPKSRYYSPSAHITIARLKKDIPWHNLISLCNQVDRRDSKMSDISFKIDNLEIVNGLNYYGKGDAIQMFSI